MFKWLNNLIDSNEKEISKLRSLVERTNGFEPDFKGLSDAELREQGERFRKRIQEGESLDALLPEVFAAVRETAVRAIGQRHFDVQLMGGIVLHQGKIAEMKTGEGKTLVATLSTTLNALTGLGVHIVTVNDYLAKRDTQWMGPIYHRLGLSVACLQHDTALLYDPSVTSEDPRLTHLRPLPRREAYQTDVLYGTNSEFGFDYLRDNMVLDLSHCVQRKLNYAIVDEVDNILIDEARTPLIISGAADESTQQYYTFARLVPRLGQEQEYTVDEKTRSVSLTESGIAKLEKWLNIPNLYDPNFYAITHLVENALKAHVLFKRDRDYMVKDGEVVIVDEFTGRQMPGRRWSDGIHQAVEAKEGLRIQRESLTLATITLQNYFRLYKKLAGMTGTAVTEAEEFHKIYNLEVVVIPTHKPMIRAEFPDQVYKTEEAKYRAAVKEIEERYRKGQPVLVGTVSIEKSELLSQLLQRPGVPHQVLNAKLHEREAPIVAQAGRSGTVTIATNMAGRGTDILLGGNPEGMALDEMQRRRLDPDQNREEYEKLLAEFRRQCLEDREKVIGVGGLHIIGTERHEARRIDNQLRGRSGRQGDPGSSCFYVSLEDDILRRFGGDRIKSFMEWAGLEDDVPIEHNLVSKSLENAQVKVEAYNFDIRKHLVEYDDVMNAQRDLIYTERQKILSGTDLKANILDMVDQVIEDLVDRHLPEHRQGEWDIDGLLAAMETITGLAPAWDESEVAAMSNQRRGVKEDMIRWADDLYEQKEQELGPENMRVLERLVMLRTIDSLWVEHLTAMENMRQGIGLRAYGQTDPLVAYKKEAYQMFDLLKDNIQHDIVHTIYRVSLTKEVAPRRSQAVRTNRGDGTNSGGREHTRAATKVGRNDPCPCGSGKKYKKCHGA